MKIFWSWQSDTPGKVGRHFVRKTIENAIQELKSEIVLSEPERELHLDHDRKGVSGSPDLANTIFEKIDETTVFIADVTLTGMRPESKATINPNVAIELGYALSKVGDQGLLMVQNIYYGNREGLPFDLKHKAGPIEFSLGPEALKEEIQKEESILRGKFKTAIRECIAASEKNIGKVNQEHSEIKSTTNSAIYFKFGDVLAERRSHTRTITISYNKLQPLAYLRVIPKYKTSALKQLEARNIVFGIKLRPFNTYVGDGQSWARNRFGGITFASERVDNDELILTTSQVFLNREIWGIDASLMYGEKFIRATNFEILIEKALKHYIEIADKFLELKPPVTIEAGAVEIQDFMLAMPDDWGNNFRGPIYENEFKYRNTLNSFEEKSINNILVNIYQEFFDAFGEVRPDNFREFPN